jgi:serine/threonine-protein kinase
MIDLDRWREVKAIVQAALDHPTEERSAYLDEACGSDAALRRAVEELLAVTEASADFFDHYQVLPPSLQKPFFEEGDLVRSFRIIRSLGEGGMGMVYLAHDVPNDRTVALKTVPRRGTRALTREQQLLAKLHHPNIAILFESGTTAEGFGFFAMEYVDGEPITSYCTKRNLSVEERLKLFLTVCDTLSFAHSNLVVHRDIKPRNILVTPQGEPKLLDFGIAKLLPSSASATLTRPEDRSLTIAFASPEQLEGEHTNTATDIYSLGVLLCLLLTGRLPYPVKSYQDLPWAIKNMGPEKPSQLVLREEPNIDEGYSTPPGSRMKVSRRLRGDLDAIVLRALRKEPEKRYQTVAQLADDIRRSLAYEPISARKGSVRYYLSKIIQKKKGAVAAAALIVLLLISSALLLLLEQRRTLQQQRRAARLNQLLLDTFSRLDPAELRAETVTAQELLGYAAQAVTTQQDLPAADRLSLLATLGDVYLSLGLYQEVTSLLNNPLTQIKGIVESDPTTAHHLLLNLASAHYYVNHFQEAARLADQAESLAPTVTNPDLALAQALHMQVIIKWKQGAFPAANSLYERALALKRHISVEQNEDLARTLSGLGVLLSDMGEYDRAEVLLNECLSIRRRIFQDGHPDTAEALFNLGLLHHHRGKYAEAHAAYIEALATYRHIFGNKHPRVGSILTSLGALEHAEGKPKEAETHLREAVVLCRRTLGEESQAAATAMSNLAALLRDQGQHTEAEDLYRKVLAIDERVLGEHPRTANTLSNLGSLLRDTGRYEEGLEVKRRAVEMLRRKVGNTHPDLGNKLNGLAVILKDLGRIDEAESAYREALAISRAALGPDHNDVIIAQNNLASLLRDQGKTHEATQLLVECIERATATLGPGHRHVATFRMNLARTLIMEGRYQEARQEILDVRRLFLATLPADHVLIAKAEGTLGESLTGLQQYQEAEPLLTRSFNRIREVEGDSSPNTRLAVERLARLYSVWGRPQEASRYQQLLLSLSAKGQ